MWEIHELRQKGAIHVVPRKDDDKHTLSPHCKCEPRMEQMNNGVKIYIHDSFDGRIAVEMANDILNDKD